MNIRVIVVSLVFVAWAAAAAFGWGSVVASYADPGYLPNGLGYINVGGTAYITLTTNDPDRVWRLYRSNGSVQGSFAGSNSETMGNDAGMIGTTACIWTADSASSYVYRRDFTSGSVYGSWSSPVPAGYPNGVAYMLDGGSYYIWLTERANNYLYRMNATTGSIYSSYHLGYAPYDLGYGGGYLWISNGSNAINKCTTTGSTVSSFPTTGIVPTGVAYDPTGPYIWVGTGGMVNRIFVYELGNNAVLPGSLGRVKAVYR